jgi:glucosyl-3-phosphoglycerate synthase
MAFPAPGGLASAAGGGEMADFYQTGVVTTLHRLGHAKVDQLERDLERFTVSEPVALVLPCLVDELERPALPHIVEQLRRVRYLDTVVVSLGRASLEGLVRARDLFARSHQRVRVIWLDGPRVVKALDRLREAALLPADAGKGFACWIAYGLVLSEARCHVVAVHDCDITTYDRELLARLCYPVVHPSLGFEFAKGYYARVTDRMHGRVTRLFMTPLLRSLQVVAGRHPLLVYLDSFRYALAGEFAMKADLARVNRIPSDWGLEVGMLAEVYRNCTLQRICQAELCANYDHKHQNVSADDRSRGLMRMCTDIAQNLIRTLAAEGIVFSEGVFQTLLVQYIRMAQDTIIRYHADAAFNGLAFDRHDEETTVAVFSEALRAAYQRFLEDPLGAPLIPNWNRIAAALPDYLDQLRAAVDEDTLEYAAS